MTTYKEQIITILFKNRIGLKNEHILKRMDLDDDNDKISKKLHDLKNKERLLITVAGSKYKLSDKGMNYATIYYGLDERDMTDNPTHVVNKTTIKKPLTKKQPLKSVGITINNPVKDPIKTESNSDKQKIKYILDKALKLKPSKVKPIIDLNNKLEVLGVVSKLVNDKLSYWINEIITDLKEK